MLILHGIARGALSLVTEYENCMTSFGNVVVVSMDDDQREGEA